MVAIYDTVSFVVVFHGLFVYSLFMFIVLLCFIAIVLLYELCSKKIKNLSILLFAIGFLDHYLDR